MKLSHFQSLLLKTSRWMEQIIAAIILIAVAVGLGSLCWSTLTTLLRAPVDFSPASFFASALMLVMGIEFVKLLALHTAGAVLHVLLFTLVRQMIVNHAGAFETLLGIASIAGVFAIQRFLAPQNDDLDPPAR